MQVFYTTYSLYLFQVTATVSTFFPLKNHPVLSKIPVFEAITSLNSDILSSPSAIDGLEDFCHQSQCFFDVTRTLTFRLNSQKYSDTQEIIQ